VIDSFLCEHVGGRSGISRFKKRGTVGIDGRFISGCQIEQNGSTSRPFRLVLIDCHKGAHSAFFLAAELGVHVLDCRKPYLPFSEFYNEPLSDGVEMDRDFANYKSELGTTRDRLLTPPSDRCPFQENFVSCIIRSF
jgi:hypothetical protein